MPKPCARTSPPPNTWPSSPKPRNPPCAWPTSAAPAGWRPPGHRRPRTPGGRPVGPVYTLTVARVTAVMRRLAACQDWDVPLDTFTPRRRRPPPWPVAPPAQLVSPRPESSLNRLSPRPRNAGAVPAARRLVPPSRPDTAPARPAAPACAPRERGRRKIAATRARSSPSPARYAKRESAEADFVHLVAAVSTAGLDFAKALGRPPAAGRLGRIAHHEAGAAATSRQAGGPLP
jgi:hypothetical protein